MLEKIKWRTQQPWRWLVLMPSKSQPLLNQKALVGEGGWLPPGMERLPWRIVVIINLQPWCVQVVPSTMGLLFDSQEMLCAYAEPSGGAVHGQETAASRDPQKTPCTTPWAWVSTSWHACVEPSWNTIGWAHPAQPPQKHGASVSRCCEELAVEEVF